MQKDVSSWSRFTLGICNGVSLPAEPGELQFTLKSIENEKLMAALIRASTANNLYWIESNGCGWINRKWENREWNDGIIRCFISIWMCPTCVCVRVWCCARKVEKGRYEIIAQPTLTVPIAECRVPNTDTSITLAFIHLRLVSSTLFFSLRFCCCCDGEYVGASTKLPTTKITHLIYLKNSHAAAPWNRRVLERHIEATKQVFLELR